MERIYDVSDPAFHADPFPVYRRLRDEFPVYHDPERQSWVLSRFEDVHAAALSVLIDGLIEMSVSSTAGLMTWVA